MPDAGEHIEDLALELDRHADAVGGEQRQVELAGKRDGGLVARLLFADAVPLQLDVDFFDSSVSSIKRVSAS